MISDSVAAAGLFADNALAWVHIDARHDYDSVVADISAWAPKVQPGGWLSGDDYHAEAWPGVVGAVTDTLPDARPVVVDAVAVDQTWLSAIAPIGDLSRDPCRWAGAVQVVRRAVLAGVA